MKTTMLGRMGVFTLSLATALTVFLGSVAHAQQKKPNILVIWGDDIGIHNISAYSLGVMGYKTPNSDRLAREGAAHRPGTVAEGARDLQDVPADAGSGELQPGPGHGTAQEGAGPPEPVTKLKVLDHAGGPKGPPVCLVPSNRRP